MSTTHNTDDYVIMENYLFAIGHSNDHTVIGICFLDKYCWTNIFGFEILK